MRLREHYRRQFLQLLLGSPLFALATGLEERALAKPQPRGLPVPTPPSPPAGSPAVTTTGLVVSPADALDLADLEAVAQRRIPPAHWGYLICGADDERTARMNVEAFLQLALRPRYFVDATKVDTSVKLLGRTYKSPILLAPISSQAMFHHEAEIGTAKAAHAQERLMVLSGVSNASLAKVVEAQPSPGHVWAQLYPTDRWEVAEALIRNAERSGCEVLVFTIDNPARGNRPSIPRRAKADPRDCSDCHNDDPLRPTAAPNFLAKFGTYGGIDVAGVKTVLTPITWDFIDRVRRATRLKIVVKGVLTAEDASDAVRHGIDGIWVSNHGGRWLDSGAPTVEALPEIVAAVAGKAPIIFDGGVRHGTDAFKALALGATAVALGRPQIWGLGAFGSAGVSRVLELVQRELEITMRQCGTAKLADISRSHVRWRAGNTTGKPPG